MTQLLSIHKDNSELENYKAIVEIVSYVEWAGGCTEGVWNY